MSEYVERDGETVYRPPYLEADTFLTSWVLPSKMEALQEVLDVALNRPSKGKVEYRPLLPAVMMVLADIQRVSSLDPRDKDRGWIDEQDVCFWMLCGGYKDKKLDRLAWYIPYIWVTNGYTMATGRETYGYPKAFGWAEIPRNATDPGPYWGDGLVLVEYTPDTEVTRQRIVTIGRDAPSPPLQTWDDGLVAAKSMLKMMFDVAGSGIDWHLVMQLMEDLWGKHLPMVFLKQFRSVTEPTAACYQAIVEANATVTAFKGAGPLPGGWDLDIKQYASVSIADKLALAPRQKVDVGFWVNFSFSMDLTKEVWRCP
jgi:hypothetical protein